MDIAHFNWADYSIIAVILISIVVSLFRGFIRESLSLVTWVVAFWVAIHFCEPLGEQLKSYIHSPDIRVGVAFGALFVVTLLLGALFNHLVGQLVQKTGLSGTDRMLGIFFGLGRGVLLIALLMLAANFTEMPDSQWWHSSLLIGHFQGVAHWLQTYLPHSSGNNPGVVA